MARILSKTLHRTSLQPIFNPRALITHRHCSDQSGQTLAQLVEAEVDSSSESDSHEADTTITEVTNAGITKLEEAIHRIVVRRDAPDWLPFLPGYSYWIPPRTDSNVAHHPHDLLEAIGKLTSVAAYVAMPNNGAPVELLKEDETMAFSYKRGWPSSSYFIEGTSPNHPGPVVEARVQIHDNANSVGNASRSEDEEG